MNTKVILEPHHALVILLHFTIICVLGVIYCICQMVFNCVFFPNSTFSKDISLKLGLMKVFKPQKLQKLQFRAFLFIYFFGKLIKCLSACHCHTPSTIKVRRCKYCPHESDWLEERSTDRCLQRKNMGRAFLKRYIYLI